MKHSDLCNLVLAFLSLRSSEQRVLCWSAFARMQVACAVLSVRSDKRAGVVNLHGVFVASLQPRSTM